MTNRPIDDEDRLLMHQMHRAFKEIVHKLTELDDPSPSLRASGALLVRIGGSLRSIFKLLNNCSDAAERAVHGIDVAAILRCLHDAAIQLEYILQGDTPRRLSADALGQLYLDYEIVERYRLAQQGVSYSSQLAQHLASSPLRIQGEAELQRAFERVRANYYIGQGPRLRSTWYSGNLPQIAEKLGRREEHFWFLRTLDSSIHSGPLAVWRGPTPVGADQFILAQNLACSAAKKFIAASGIAVSAESNAIMEAASADILNIGPASTSGSSNEPAPESEVDS